MGPLTFESRECVSFVWHGSTNQTFANRTRIELLMSVDVVEGSLFLARTIVHNLRLCFVWRSSSIVLWPTCECAPATFSLPAQLLPTFCSTFGFQQVLYDHFFLAKALSAQLYITFGALFDKWQILSVQIKFL